jgi:hypothetical protein
MWLDTSAKIQKWVNLPPPKKKLPEKVPVHLLKQCLAQADDTSNHWSMEENDFYSVCLFTIVKVRMKTEECSVRIYRPERESGMCNTS